MDCSTLLTLCLEIIDSLQNDTKYYMQGLYENALLSENRKMMENLQTKLYSKVDEMITDDFMPFAIEDIKYAQDQTLTEMNQEFLEKINPMTLGKPTLECYYELQTNITDLLHRKQTSNEEISTNICKEFLDTKLQQLTEVKEISPDDLRSPFLMSNLEELFQSIITEYFNTTKGGSQCKNFSSDKLMAETMPSFILNYCKELFTAATTSKQEQVFDLQNKLASVESQNAMLLKKIESEQTANIEQQRRKAEYESEIRVKDIQIERLQRKAVQDLEILEENCKTLEERLRERNEDVRILREVY